MKICHMTSAHNSKDVRIFYKECVTLSDAGYDVYLVAPGESREEAGVHVVGVGDKPSSRIKRLLNTSKTVFEKALEVNADVYHIHDPELLPYAIKLRKRKKKVIFDSHENTLEYMEQKEYIPKCLRKIVGVSYRKYATKIFANLDALISVTPAICKQLREINPNTVMVTNYPFISKKEELYFEKNPRICFTGGISEQWCIDKIVNAINETDDITFALCGVADESYLRMLKTLDGWKKCDYHGVVNHKEAVEIQEASMAGMAIINYSKNTFGHEGTLGNTKLFEYMAAQIPVICTDFVLWREIIEKYYCGICVNPNNKDEIVEAICVLKNNPDLVMTMGQNGRTAIEKEYNWETQKPILVELYKNLQE